MKKAKRSKRRSYFFVVLKYVFIIYVLFLVALLRSKTFYLVAIVIYIGFFYYFLKKSGSIKSIPSYIISEFKYVFANVSNKIKKGKVRQVRKILLTYKSEFIICLIYIGIMLSVISWGLPSNNHPFPYFMDESHSLQAVKTVVRYGSSNLPHQEVGPMFNYVISAVLVSPLFIFRIINPFVITTAISALIVQAQLYMALRFITLIFGVLTLFVLVKISKIFKINSALLLALFVFTPVWLSISNYFKYDLALVFWIVLSVFLMLSYYKKPTVERLIMIGIATGLAVSTKVTGISLLFLYIFTFVYFTPNFKKKLKNLFIGFMTYIVTVIFCGIPDIIFGGRSMLEYLQYNIFSNPQNDRNFILGTSHLNYIFTQQLPTIFGHFLFPIVCISVAYLIIKIYRAFSKKILNSVKLEVFILVTLVLFSSSLTPLWIISANRALVLLPFMVIIVGLFVKDIFLYAPGGLKKVVFVVLVFGVLLQIFESYSWVSLKYVNPPQAESSTWVIRNIPKGTLIGIENIPIYQMLPDIIVREFYEKQYGVKKKYLYKYEIIDYKSAKLPGVVILSNAKFERDVRTVSPKKNLVERLYKEGYHEVREFSPNPKYYRYFMNDLNFVVAGMTSIPIQISVYVKNDKLPIK